MNFPVKEAAGMLYCKLISPARVLEWMLVDGLYKNLYWIPSDPSEDKYGDKTNTYELIQ